MRSHQKWTTFSILQQTPWENLHRTPKVREISNRRSHPKTENWMTLPGIFPLRDFPILWLLCNPLRSPFAPLFILRIPGKRKRTRTHHDTFRWRLENGKGNWSIGRKVSINQSNMKHISIVNMSRLLNDLDVWSMRSSEASNILDNG